MLKKFFNQNNGFYKVMFTVCILVLSLVIISFTENSDFTDAPATENQKKTVDETVINKDSIQTVIDSLDKNLNVSNKVDNPATPKTKNVEKEYLFTRPLYGKIIKPFSVEIPLYSKTMDDWRIHEGVDVACVLGSEVYACEDGVVEEVGYNMLFGNFVTLKCGDYLLKYASLSSDISFAKGDNVYKGQVIGTVDSSCVSEICDEPHFHFEVSKNGELIDPCSIIMFE